MIVGCGCGSCVYKKIPDEEYGLPYVIVTCSQCGYYWEGYMAY